MHNTKLPVFVAFGDIGIRGLMRGMATLPKVTTNQELLLVRDKVGRPQVSLG